MKKLPKAVYIFFLAHFFGQLLFLLKIALFGFMSEEPEKISIFTKIFWNILDIFIAVCQFPIVFIYLKYKISIFNGILEYIPFVINSLLWTTVFYFSLYHFKKSRA